MDPMGFMIGVIFPGKCCNKFLEMTENAWFHDMLF